jgi:hypothetical protein
VEANWRALSVERPAQPFSFLWQSKHFTGALLPLAASVLWQSMQIPAVAVGLWNAACSLVFIGGTAVLVWHAPHACCGAVAGFSGRLGWWHVAHGTLRVTAWSLCGKRTFPIVALRTATSGGVACVEAGAGAAFVGADCGAGDAAAAGDVAGEVSAAVA